MSEKNEKIYIGSGKTVTTKYGKMLKLLLGKNDMEKILLWQKENNGWCTIDICERKEISDKGYTHYGIIDQWKTNAKGNATEVTAGNLPDSDNLPF